MKVDFKKTLKALYGPSAKDFSVVTVPTMNYMMVDGEGNPNTSTEYAEAITTLYSVAYTLKFQSKLQKDRDYVVPPLEGLWWADDLNAYRNRTKDNWKWTMMIMVPDWLKKTDVDEAIKKAHKKNPELHGEQIRFESLTEGLSVQIMHIGSYDDETPTLLRLHDEWLPQNGYKETLKHHEIYIGDPRKTNPSRLKTVLRQPVIKIN